MAKRLISGANLVAAEKQARFRRKTGIDSLADLEGMTINELKVVRRSIEEHYETKYNRLWDQAEAEALVASYILSSDAALDAIQSGLHRVQEELAEVRHEFLDDEDWIAVTNMIFRRVVEKGE